MHGENIGSWKLFVAFLKFKYIFSDIEVVEAALDLVLSCCVLHEMNRQNLVKNGLLDKLDAVFDKNKIQGKILAYPDVLLGLSLLHIIIRGSGF